MTRNNKIVLVSLAMLILGYGGFQVFGTAMLSLTSEPAQAIVRVDGSLAGDTPLEDFALAPGVHRLEVEHSHFATFDEQITIGFGERFERHIVLAPGTGTLSLLSRPLGAWVEVDGERLPNRTPTRIDLVSGEHEIRMGLLERRSVQETVVVSHDKTNELNLDLNIDPHGSVTVAARPRGSTIEFPELGIAYVPGVRIPIGEHLIRVSKAGYVTQAVRYTVRYRDNLVNVELVRDYGNLRVITNPADAEIQVTYVELDSERVQRLTYTPNMRLPVGRVEVIARAIGRRSEYRNFYLSHNGYTTRMNLESMNVEAGTRFRDSLKDGSEGPPMIIVPPGSFVMGDAAGSMNEKPARTVTLTQPFSVSVFEVTIADYLLFATQTGKEIHPRIDKSEANYPMRHLGWVDARDYSNWLSEQTGNKYRLLTEAEWEYVARAGTQTQYYFGDDISLLCNHVNLADLTTASRYRDWQVVDCEDGYAALAPVGSLLANAFGLHDVYGNVAEWVMECGMPSYVGGATDGSPLLEPGCTGHAFRGGSWDSKAFEVRSAARNSSLLSNGDRGFRVMREL
ncbi:MAG: SUMF1/EgtB/PvdO family nonheme iron enzyme [Gammaproteobacteria bacterium]|nr:SUMF1/EgtB/PvdO family nonheme iron enzyme [Gammaproteobacteria bacterium]